VYAVIFRAKIKKLDSEYSETVSRMQHLAIQEYGCTEFISSYENGYEITISYWESLEKIKKWKQNEEHQKAQQQGKLSWYENYNVQIAEILRDYSHNS